MGSAKYSEQQWAQQNMKDTFEGQKIFYRCNTVRGSKCPVKCYLLRHETGQEGTIYVSDDAHVHELLERQTIGMSFDVETRINELYSQGTTTPMTIIRIFFQTPTADSDSAWKWLLLAKNIERRTSFNQPILQPIRAR